MPIPTEEGRYWWRADHRDPRWALVEVEESDGAPWCLVIVTGEGGTPELVRTQALFEHGQWGGHATPPDHCDEPYRVCNWNDPDYPSTISKPCPDCDGYWMCDPSGAKRFCPTCEGRGYLLTEQGENDILAMAEDGETRPPSGLGDEVDALARHRTREAAARIRERRDKETTTLLRPPQ